MSPRYLSRKKVMNGLFPEATVVRGHNWKWGNQDGQLEGVCVNQKRVWLSRRMSIVKNNRRGEVMLTV